MNEFQQGTRDTIAGLAHWAAVSWIYPPPLVHARTPNDESFLVHTGTSFVTPDTWGRDVTLRSL